MDKEKPKLIWILQNDEIADEVFELTKKYDVQVRDSKGTKFQVLDLKEDAEGGTSVGDKERR